jgi:hypothetical protein
MWINSLDTYMFIFRKLQKLRKALRASERSKPWQRGTESGLSTTMLTTAYSGQMNGSQNAKAWVRERPTLESTHITKMGWLNDECESNKTLPEKC